MALFSQQPKKGENLESSYTKIDKSKNVKMYEAPPPTSTRANSIGTALSMMFGKSLEEHSEVRPASADSPLTP